MIGDLENIMKEFIDNVMIEIKKRGLTIKYRKIKYMFFVKRDYLIWELCTGDVNLSRYRNYVMC